MSAGFVTTTVYAYIITFWLKFGYSPSIRDIQEGCGISSTSVVAFHLVKLQEKKLIQYKKGHSRTITVVGSTWIRPVTQE